MGEDKSKQDLYIKLLFSLTSLEGIIFIFLLFQRPSMGHNAIFFGFSTPRIILGIFSFFMLSAFLIATRHTYKNTITYHKYKSCLIKWLGIDKHLLTSIIIILLTCISIITFLLFIPNLQNYFSSLLSPEFDYFISTIIAIITITRPVFTWAVLFFIQFICVLIIIFKGRFLDKHFYNFEIIYRIFIVYLMLIVTTIHWIILYYQLYVFIAIPNWFWKFYQKPTVHNKFFIFLFVLSILVIIYIIKHPNKTTFNLFTIIFLGYILTVGFGYIENDGFETLRQLFIQKGHWGYAKFACTQPDLLQTLINYENVAQLDPFFKTKPPGIFAFYITIQKFIELIFPSDSIEVRYYILTKFMSYVFPLFAFFVLIPLYHLGKKISDKSNAIFSCVLFVFFPNVILTPLFLDQEFYPLLFVTGLLICLLMIEQQSRKWAFFTGCFSYIALYFSFSLLPLIPMVLIFLGIEYMQSYKKRNIWKLIQLIFFLFLGLIFTYLLFRIVLNYDIILRYTNALENHRAHKEFSNTLQSILNAIFVNNSEFFSWIGFPIVILLFSALGRTIYRFIKQNTSLIDGFIVSFFIVYLLLNLSGQTHGEVARLWIFLVPIVSFIASCESNLIFKKKSFSLLYIVSLQLLTMFLIFRFQDLD